MVLHMGRANPPKNPPKFFTIFVRGMRGHEADTQRADCKREAAKWGVPIRAEYNGNEPDDREDWVNRARSDEGVMVSGLYVIPAPRSEGKSPSADYASVIQRLVRKVQIVVDAETGITSDDGDAWDELVKSGANVTAAGRKMTSERGRKMREKQLAIQGPPVKEAWAAPEMAKERLRWEQFWRDPKYRGMRDEEVFALMPARIRKILKSHWMARRMLKSRNPGDPSAGGRGKKRKRKR